MLDTRRKELMEFLDAWIEAGDLRTKLREKERVVKDFTSASLHQHIQHAGVRPSIVRDGKVYTFRGFQDENGRSIEVTVTELVE